METGYILSIILGVLLIIGALLLGVLKRGIDDIKESLDKTIKERDHSIEKEKIIAQELEKKKIENLRFALNPHAFKNTLGAIEHNAKKTLQSVENLSGIFDYMLYDAKSQFVPLSQELQFASDYLGLNKVRIKPVVNVTSKPFQNESLKQWGKNKLIAPLILAHFIENAIKHGDLESDDSFIKIQIDIINENEIIYSVRNKISKGSGSQKGGIGNATFKDRLELLYKDNYECDYQIEGNVHSANLKLALYDK